jgi:hypothetical protein
MRDTKRVLCWTLIAGCILAGPLWGSAEEFKLAWTAPKAQAMKGFEPQSLQTRGIVVAPKDCGTVHPQARVAAFTADGLKVTISLDSTNADAKHPDLVRFNFAGKPGFQGAPTVPLKQGMSPKYANRLGIMRAGEYYHFGPATLKVARGKMNLPVSVSGTYFVGTGVNKWREASLALVATADGSVRFGDKVCGVRVVDGTSNLRFGDGLGVTQKDGQVILAAEWRGFTADRVWIDTASETFKSAGVKVYCGQLARIGEKLYRISVSKDASKITVEPAKTRIGKVLIPGDEWSATLVGTKHVLHLSGGKEPIEVPADQYVVTNYKGRFNSDVASKPHHLHSGYYVLIDREKTKVFDVKGGQTTKIGDGAPLTAEVSVTQSKGTVKLNLLARDASGGRISNLYGPKGRPPAPKVTIYDDKRQEVYSTSLEYG